MHAKGATDGPQPIPVPAIVGRTWFEARTMLTEAGLGFTYWNPQSEFIGEGIPSSAIVTQIDPEAGVELKRGDAVKVKLAVG